MARQWERVMLMAGMLAAQEASAQWAPQIPSDHAAAIVRAAGEAGVDPAFVAATAAQESEFSQWAWRAEPGQPWVLWRDVPGGPKKWVVDGSIGAMQIMRSTLKMLGVDNDAEAYDLATNYRLGALYLRDNLNRCGSVWAAATAYNSGSCWGRTTGNYAQLVTNYYGAYRGSLDTVRAECTTTKDDIRRWYALYLGRDADEGSMAGRVGNRCELVESIIRDSEEAQRRRDTSHCVTTETDIQRWYGEYLGRDADQGAMYGRVGNTCAVVEGVIRDSEEAKIRRGELALAQ